MSLEQGDAIALSGADRGTLTTSRAGQVATLEFPRGALLPLLKDPRRGCAHRVRHDSVALRLLRAYVEAAHAAASADTALPQLVVAHIHDLAALAVGAARDAAEQANGRGVRAARLQAIKQDILSRIDRDIALDALASRHQVSARYIRMLFASEGTSVSEFVRDERLKRARSLLLRPSSSRRPIAEVAYAVGFNDLSYFNRAFRRRFGQSPREMRDGNVSPVDRAEC